MPKTKGAKAVTSMEGIITHKSHCYTNTAQICSDFIVSILYSTVGPIQFQYIFMLRQEYTVYMYPI